jgi:hypothetical protein
MPHNTIPSLSEHIRIPASSSALLILAGESVDILYILGIMVSGYSFTRLLRGLPTFEGGTTFFGFRILFNSERGSLRALTTWVICSPTTKRMTESVQNESNSVTSSIASCTASSTSMSIDIKEGLAACSIF